MLRGSFLSDPAWTMARAVSGLENFSESYTDNRWADWKLTVKSCAAADVDLILYKDGNAISGSDWIIRAEDGTLSFLGNNRNVLWTAGPKDTVWEIKAFDKTGTEVPCAIEWTAEYQNL